MKPAKHFFISILIGYFFITGLAPVSAQAENLAPLLEKIAMRMNSYPENDNWKARIVTKNTEMDKQWRPKKTTITTAIVKTVDGMLSSRILEAVETEDGVSKDVTQKISEQTEKQIENANKATAKQRDEGITNNSLDTLFPFNREKRGRFDFRRLNDAVIDQRPVYIIEAVAKAKDEELYDGKFYVDQRSFDVLRAQIKPSKNPIFVKELDIDMHFEVLPEGNYITKRSWTRIKGGPFFKRIRAIIEVEYFDVDIFDEELI